MTLPLFLPRLRVWLQRKGISLNPRVYFVDAFGAMALGLFTSLLVGTILKTLGSHLGVETLVTIGDFASKAMGAAIGVSIASCLKCSGLLLYCSGITGMLGVSMGGPVGAYLATLLSMELGKIVYRSTPIDILLTPLVALGVAWLTSYSFGAPIDRLMTHIGMLIEQATTMQPLLMGVVVSVLVGILLTLPISSAAICISIGLGGLAAGAATAGCCAQMIGFAVMSFPDNRWNGLVAQGLGTSMLQMPNIIRKPIVWLPPILSSAITGPLATCVLHIENVPVAAGMGTCGLVGPIGIYSTMGSASLLAILLICFILPALLTTLFAYILRRLGYLRRGDLLLDL